MATINFETATQGATIVKEQVNAVFYEYNEPPKKHYIELWLNCGKTYTMTFDKMEKVKEVYNFIKEELEKK